MCAEYDMITNTKILISRIVLIYFAGIENKTQFHAFSSDCKKLTNKRLEIFLKKKK